MTQDSSPKIYSTTVRLQNRDDSYDGNADEYADLYWRPMGVWILEGNAGAIASSYHDYVDACVDANCSEEQLEEARGIQAEIDEIVSTHGEAIEDTDTMGADAIAFARQHEWTLTYLEEV